MRGEEAADDGFPGNTCVCRCETFSITWREWPDWRHSWVEENLRIVRAFTPTEKELPAKAEQESPYLICPSVLTRASVKSAYCSRNKPDLWPPSAWVCIILQLPPLPTPARLWTFSLPVTPPYVSLPKVVCGNVRSDGSKRVLTNWIKTGWMMYTPHTHYWTRINVQLQWQHHHLQAKRIIHNKNLELAAIDHYMQAHSQICICMI